MKRMIITAKYVFPISSKPLKEAGVLVRGEKIVEVDAIEALKRHYPEEEVIDLGKAALMPGFVNLHTRTERTLLRGSIADEPYETWLLKTFELTQLLSLNEKQDSARIGCLEAIRTGTTTIADIASTPSSCQAISDYGLRGIVYRDCGGLDQERVEHAAKVAERDINDWSEKYGSDLLQIGIVPHHTFETHPLMFTKASELARKYNIPMQVHAGSSLEEFDFISKGSSMFSQHAPDDVEKSYVDIAPWMPFGVSPVEFVKNWGAFDADNVTCVNPVHVTDDDISTFRKYNVGTCICPGTEAQLGMGAAPVAEFLENKINVGLGSDSPMASENQGMMHEMRFAMLISRCVNARKYLRSSHALELGTLGGAKVLHIDDKVGTLEPGKLADITAVDLNNSLQVIELNPISAVINTCGSGDVTFTMVNGKILYRDGDFTFDVDGQAILDRVHKARLKLLEKERKNTNG